MWRGRTGGCDSTRRCATSGGSARAWCAGWCCASAATSRDREHSRSSPRNLRRRSGERHRTGGDQREVSEIRENSGCRLGTPKSLPAWRPQHGRTAPYPRPGSRGPSPLPAVPSRLPGRSPSARALDGQQGQPPPPRRHRVRGPRPGSPARSPRPASRSRRAQQRGYQGCSVSCPHCHEPAACVALRGKSVVTLIGTVRLQRHYYHCPACRRGFCPWDAVLGLTPAALSPAADEVTCLAGVQASFAEASAKTLPKLAGLHLGESTVERATEAAGQRVGAALAGGQTFGPKRDWAWHKDADGKAVAYLAADATGVAQQGPGGAEAEGRMANVAVIDNPVPDDPAAWANPAARRRPAWHARYLASLGSFVEWGQAL